MVIMIVQYTFRHDKKQASELCIITAIILLVLMTIAQVSKLTRSIKETQARVEEQEEELEAERLMIFLQIVVRVLKNKNYAIVVGEHVQHVQP